MPSPDTVQPLDFVLVAAYALLVVLVGWYFRRSVKGAKDYFAAGSTMPWWVAGMSFFMVSFSVVLFIIYNEIAYRFGVVALTITWVHGSTMLVAGILLAHRWRRARVITPLGFMERRYSGSVHQLFVWAGFPLRLFDNGMRIYGTAIVLIIAVIGIGVHGDVDDPGAAAVNGPDAPAALVASDATIVDQGAQAAVDQEPLPAANPEAGISARLLITVVMLLGIFFILYTWMGGQGAVMITDFVQAIILLLAIGFISWLCLAQFDGLGDFWSKLPAGHREWVQPIPTEALVAERAAAGIPFASGYDWIYLLTTLFLLAVMNNAAGWALVQKYNCVRSEQDARKMVWMVTILKLVTPPLFFLPGLAAVYLMPDEIANTRYAFAQVAFKYLPVGLMGLMLAAMFSAATSTLGAEFNTLSGILTRDFYKRRLRPHAKPRDEIAFGRWATLGIGLVTMTIACAYHFAQELTLMDLMHRVFGAFGPPIFIPIFLGLLTRRFNARGVWIGVIAGATVGFALASINITLTQIHSDRMMGGVNEDPIFDWQMRTLFNSVIVVANCLTVVGGMWLGSWLWPNTAEETAQVEEFFVDLRRPYLLDATTKATESPFRLIGMTTFWFGMVMLGIAFFVLARGYEFNAFLLNLLAAVIMIGLGAIMWLASGGRQGDILETEAERKDPVGAGRE